MIDVSSRSGPALFGVVVVAFGLATGSACAGAPPGTDLAPVGVVSSVVDPGMVARSWPLSYATQADQDKLTAVEGWVPLMMKRNYKVAARELGAGGGMPGARGHADASALFRQASMVAAYSFLGTYAENPQPTDPVGTAHLLSVSYVLIGDLENARLQSAKLDAFPDDPTIAWHAPWKAWLAQPSPAWPPDLSALPLGYPAPAGGEWPELPPLPTYTMPELAPSGASVAMADPGLVIALALWHDQVAHQLAGDQGAVVDTYLARYHFPIEPDVAGVDLPPEFLVASDFLVPEDGPFMADLLGANGDAAVETWKDRSLLASIAAASRTGEGRFSGELAGNASDELRIALEGALREKNGGQDNGAHRTFVDTAKAGVLRTLPFVAEVEDRRASEESGKLRILAMEIADVKEPAACPAGLLSLAAWDAGNRYTMRGSDILHNATRRYPAVEASRYALDVLALRVSREAPRVEPNQ